MTLALAGQNVLAQSPSPIATILSTSMVIDEVVRVYGASVIRTKIDEANVVESLLHCNCLIGGEGNGGIIVPRVAMARDGVHGPGAHSGVDGFHGPPPDRAVQGLDVIPYCQVKDLCGRKKHCLNYGRSIRRV
jgi:hypothetical protein